MNTPRLAFEPRTLRLKVSDLVPVRIIKEHAKLKRYATILSSIKEVGIIEPIVVYPLSRSPGKYLILDGHLRCEVLKELGISETDCIVSTQEESFTYNSKVNRLAPIQEHRMITRAVENGLSVERIAAALNLSVDTIRENLNLLEGIHPDTVDILGVRPISPQTLRMFKKVSPVRQIEMAELMVATNNFTADYARAMLDATPENMLVGKPKELKAAPFTGEAAARLREEMRGAEAEFKAVEATYGENVLNLTLARNYVRTLIDNPRVCRWLTGRHPDILREFESLAATEAL
ncbi:MAG TPA: plasmid partitioning protein RepB C-terminal domain-containing protein [Chthoniobacterales bacterium]